MKKLCLLLVCFSVCLLAANASWAVDETGKNIASGCSVSFDPGTSYPLCTDPDDAKQVTDGKYTTGGFWTEKEAIGWAVASPYHIKVDLGQVKPISGLMYSTAARGTAGVFWPIALVVQVSDDDVDYHYVGDLVSMDRPNGELPKLAEKDVRHQFKTNKLRTHGRYVTISIITGGGSYAFCDEVEVYVGDDSFLNEKLPGDGIKDYRTCAVTLMHGLAINERMAKDITAVRTNVKNAKVSDAVKNNLNAMLDILQSRSESYLTMPDASFKTILPLNEIEASILAVNGSLLHELKLQPITVWKKHRFDRLDLVEIPAKTKASINIDAMRNEFRADSFLITNATDKPVVLTLKISGIPGSPQPKWLQVSSVPWTDTVMREPVAAALPLAKYSKGGYEISLPAGMTRVVWITADTSTVANGNYGGMLALSTNGKMVKVPIRIRVSKIAMNRPRLSLQMWDYTHRMGDRAIGAGNRDSAIKMMQTHFVDTPWAQSDIFSYDENMNPDSFAALDDWMKLWPDARLFMVNINIGDKNEFQGAKIGTPEYHDRLGAWAKALDAHMVSLGMDPKRLGLSMLDEPHTDAQDEIVATMAKAIKDSGSRITIQQDPTWEHPEKTRIQEAMTLPDILCPNLNVYFQGGPDAQRYWDEIRKSGHSLWFYQCSGPVRTFDPTEYYRLMAWHAFKAGAVGLGFWSFGDLGGGRSSWDEYTMSTNSYAPAFIAPDGVTDSVHWQAVREGIEDYEYLSMLRDAAQKCSNPKLKSQALNLIREIVDPLTANQKPTFVWRSDPMHTAVDNGRIRALRMLEKIKK